MSKRIDSPYQLGKSTAWLKVKNQNAPGVLRFRDTQKRIQR
jgi:ATP-dependent DNA ligase